MQEKLKQINEYHRAVTEGCPGARNFPGYYEHSILASFTGNKRKVRTKFQFQFPAKLTPLPSKLKFQ